MAGHAIVYDWSENGVIAAARQIQSEYWCLTHFSLFISITSHLIVEAWLHRSSALAKGTEVTVEPEGSTEDMSPPVSEVDAGEVSRLQEHVASLRSEVDILHKAERSAAINAAKATLALSAGHQRLTDARTALQRANANLAAHASQSEAPVVPRVASPLRLSPSSTPVSPSLYNRLSPRPSPGAPT